MAANPLEKFGDMLHDSYPFPLAFNATWTKGLTERSGSCSARWNVFLANLKSRVEQGITRGVVGLTRWIARGDHRRAGLGRSRPKRR